MTPFAAEFLGTALVITIGNGVVANVVLPNTKGIMGDSFPLFWDG
jgi:glycerol uptake facilitator protein